MHQDSGNELSSDSAPYKQVSRPLEEASAQLHALPDRALAEQHEAVDSRNWLPWSVAPSLLGSTH